MRKTSLIKNILVYLKSYNLNQENWHVKEELLHILCFIFLENNN